MYFKGVQNELKWWPVSNKMSRQLKHQNSWCYFQCIILCKKYELRHRFDFILTSNQLAPLLRFLKDQVILIISPDVFHLQGEDGGDGFVITDGVLHMTSVAMLCHFGPTGQPWKRTTLPNTLTSRCSCSQTPQDPVSPSWFTFLPTGMMGETERWNKKKKNRKKIKVFFFLEHGGQNMNFHVFFWLVRTFLKERVIAITKSGSVIFGQWS